MSMIPLEQLDPIFQQVFDDDAIHVTPATTADDVDGWDSLSHVNLILALETAFQVRFSQKELLSFKNVGDLYHSINAKLETQR